MRVNIVSNIKNLKSIFLTLFFFFLIGCSDDKLIDADDNIINSVTKTIAPEIVIDDLVFSISSATFNVPPKIQLSTSVTDNSFESNHLSKLFRIEEIPYGYKKHSK